jgi:hypothetical protein
MASKKAASKKKASPARKKSGKSGTVPVDLPDMLGEDWKCNPPNICKFLEKLSYWLHQKFIPDYTALRIAVCNVEKKAFTNTGINASPPKFCSGGPVNEPAPPPPPPVW